MKLCGLMVLMLAGGTPNVRVSYSIAQVSDDVRVVADLALVSNPGSSHEQRIDLNGAAKDAPIHDVQSMLDNLRTELTSTQTSDNKPSLKKPAPPAPTAGH